MFRLVLPLCLLVCATAAVSGKRNSCPSGDIGPACDKKNPCKSGYTCVWRKCCRNAIVNECPAHIMLRPENCKTPSHQCTTDADCRKGQLCCTSPCERYCKGPGFPG
ncbi:hypothetical protein DPMN_097775 [Dreissena polymorpha]|uniref:WAP domain-containing protein n=1 Tax=Dreissena polymorpha TaxID=45954 RepID=A0A9D4R4V3_DREPO|nr:hypothetical protein DPMN_097775 [Dreissena polymorpha]